MAALLETPSSGYSHKASLSYFHDFFLSLFFFFLGGGGGGAGGKRGGGWCGESEKFLRFHLF